jgi:O-antigen ligase
MAYAPYFTAVPFGEGVARRFVPSLLVVAGLMAAIPLENATVIPAIGSIARLLGVIAVGAVVLDGTMRHGFRPLHPAHITLALFTIWSAWTFLWSVNPQLTSERITTNLQLLLLLWVIWQSVRELGDLRLVLQGFVLGSCIAVVLTFVNSHEMAAVDDIRYAGGGADPNELGLTLVISVVMTFYVSKTATTTFRRVLWLLPIPMCIAGIVLTVSRGAFIVGSLALVGISLWHITTSSRMRFAPLVVGALLLAAGAQFVPKANIQRIESIESEISTGGIGKRTRIWKAGIRLFRENAMLGTGAATFAYAAEPLVGRDLAAHNTYVSVLTETGLIGFIFFAAALITFATIAWHLNVAERFLWLIVMSVWCLGVMSLTFEYKKTTWAIFALLIATAGASRTDNVFVGPFARLLRP